MPLQWTYKIWLIPFPQEAKEAKALAKAAADGAAAGAASTADMKEAAMGRASYVDKESRVHRKLAGGTV